jgi:hypothetical protein
MSHQLETIDSSVLATITGGQAAQEQPGGDEPPARTWGQTAREYGAACLQGAGQSLIFAGRPRNAREGLKNAAMGCAMGVGMRAIDDVSNLVTGAR